ncbi:hypothetical protein PVAND_005913 [Polypedilum vanderplanki]|uniref:Uncharacterized protein n=1 Tax=Polypedilum vanderplanki TaxID=319348 RepID=A0A9J6C2M1_POLVA|nr:hypothetical protein PVAND_005913 [Polypedilum vanderplanki]
MTEFTKYGSNNYHKKLSSADKTSVGGISNATAAVDESVRKPRLKKSFSECEYYEMDSNLNFSPSRRKCRVAAAEELHRYHHCPRQTTTAIAPANDIVGVGEIAFIDVPKGQYNYDTSKSQYLLAQQQKLKEYKNDPNFLATNGDNYSSESSTETRGILKKTTTAASSTTTTTTSESNNSNNSKSLLKRNKGLSTLSLCSCDADTEVIPRQSRPLYQYSLDRKRPLHTYTCEQNAQILLRLERERLKKYGSYGRLHFTSLSGTEQQQQQKSKQNNNCRNDNGSLKDFSATTRVSGYPETNHIESNEVFMGDVNRINNNIDDDDIIPPNFPPPPKAGKVLLQRSASITNKHTSSSPVINQNEFTSNVGGRVTATNTLSSNKPDLFNFSTTATNNNSTMMDERIASVKTNNPVEINANNCQSSKIAYPLFFCDDQNRQLAYNPASVGVGSGLDEKNSVYFYHHEPPTYLPNYDNISTKYPDKYSTMPPIGSECPAGVIPLQQFNIPMSKVHASTCNLNNQLNSSNLISNHHFSNSLSNFNIMDTQLQNYYNFNPSFTQLPSSRGGPPYGSSSIIGSSFASNISLNGTPKNQQNMPWKHRQCSSRSSSSGTNSSKWDLPSRQWLALTSILLIAGAASVAVPLALSVTADSEDLKKISPWANSPWSHTDLQRLKRGRLSAQVSNLIIISVVIMLLTAHFSVLLLLHYLHDIMTTDQTHCACSCLLTIVRRRLVVLWNKYIEDK